MENIYTISDAIAKMKNSVKYYEVRVNAWKNVKRVYKKDGKPFAILSKNFTNSSFENRYGSNYISISFIDEKGSYQRDDINLDGNGYGREAATTPDEIEQRINAIIANYEKWLEIDKKGAAEIEEQIKSIIPELDKINEVIKTAKTETNTHYTLQSYIKNYLHIL